MDIETKEPAQALRERTDSCTVPAAGVVGEAMVALVLAAAYREKFGGDHIDDARAALDAYVERIGWRRSSVDGAIVFVGFMGAGKSTGARALAAELGVEAVDCDREVERQLGRADRGVLRPRGRVGLPRREEEVVRRAAGAAGRCR